MCFTQGITHTKQTHCTLARSIVKSKIEVLHTERLTNVQACPQSFDQEVKREELLKMDELHQLTSRRLSSVPWYVTNVSYSECNLVCISQSGSKLPPWNTCNKIIKGVNTGLFENVLKYIITTNSNTDY